MTGVLRIPRRAALTAIAVLVASASLVSFGESYRGLYDWAHRHGLQGPWAILWPLQVDTFIAVGELALFVALADRWKPRSRLAAWAVTLAGLAVSVAGNIGHIAGHAITDRATAAVPPLAAAAALAVGLGVLKRVVGAHPDTVPDPTAEWAALAAEMAAVAAAVAAELRIPLAVPVASEDHAAPSAVALRDVPALASADVPADVPEPPSAELPPAAADVPAASGGDGIDRLAAWLTDGAVTVLGARPAAVLPAANGHAARVPEPVPASRAPARSRTGAAHGRQRAPRHTPGPRSGVTPESAEAHFAAVLAQGQVPSLRQVKEQLSVGTDRARELRAHLESVNAST